MAKITEEEQLFESIAGAIQKGDDKELDRLMAVDEDEVTEEAEPVEEAPPVEDAAEEVESESPPEAEEDDEDDLEEAAVPAASPATLDMERELQKLRSDAGRIPSIQKRMAEMERELRAYKARDSQAPRDTEGRPTVNAKDVVLDEETQREIDELREVDPVLAKTLERIAKNGIATARASADHVVETFTQADREEEEFNFLSEQKALLVREIPQADAIFATPQWKEWKDTLTPGQRGLAESSYASEVRDAIYAFAAVMEKNQAPAAAVAAVVVPAPADAKLKEDRLRKVGASAEVKASAAKAAVEVDQDDYFTEMYNKIGKENHIL